MKKYSALDNTGKIRDIICKHDSDAIKLAYDYHWQCLIQVRSFTKPSPIRTILDFKKEGY